MRSPGSGNPRCPQGPTGVLRIKKIINRYQVPVYQVLISIYFSNCTIFQRGFPLIANKCLLFMLIISPVCWGVTTDVYFLSYFLPPPPMFVPFYPFFFISLSRLYLFVSLYVCSVLLFNVLLFIFLFIFCFASSSFFSGLPPPFLLPWCP